MYKVNNDLSPLPMQEHFINQASGYDFRKKAGKCPRLRLSLMVQKQ